MEQIWTPLHEMGRAEGFREGLAKGLAKGYAEVVLLQLRKRFGQVPPDVDTAIHALPPDRVLDLAGALLDITTLAELRAWLETRVEPEM